MSAIEHKSVSRRHVAAFVLALLVSTTQCGRNTTIPSGLMGTWRTDATKYRGCFFEIGDRYVKIGTQEGSVDAGQIRDVGETTDGGVLLYAIRYADGGQPENLLEFYYSREDGAIRLKNQRDIVWTKTKEQNGEIQ
jgi:hypothetical protein